MARNILWFNEIGMDDVKSVGGKCASLGEMTKNMGNLGIRVPYGFAISTDAYDLFMELLGRFGFHFDSSSFS